MENLIISINKDSALALHALLKHEARLSHHLFRMTKEVEDYLYAFSTLEEIESISTLTEDK